MKSFNWDITLLLSLSLSLSLYLILSLFFMRWVLCTGRSSHEMGQQLASKCLHHAPWICKLCRMESTLFLYYWYINYVFPILINFTTHILNGLRYNVEAPLKKSNKAVTSQKEKGKKYKNATTTKFWYAFIQVDQCTI